MSLDNLILIINILMSPLIATLISIYISNRYKKRNEKIKILEKLMITRLNRSSIDYVQALNVIDVVFYNSKNVRKEYKKLLEEYYSDKPNNEEINIRNLKLIEAISKDIGYTKINWEEIAKPYAPNWYYIELRNQEKFKNGQLAIADIIESINNNKEIKK